MRLIKKALLLMSVMLFSLGISAQVDLYWVGGTGDWTDFNNWSDASGGFGGDGVPGLQDRAIFDANSFDAPGQIVTIPGDIFINNMDWTGVTNTPTLDGDPTATVTVRGSLTFVVGMRHFFEGNYEFSNIGTTNIITTAGQNFLGDIVFDGMGEWIFADALSVIPDY